MVSANYYNSARAVPRNSPSGARWGWLARVPALCGGPLVALLVLSPGISEIGALDLTRATIVSPASLSRPEQKAIAMLVEEVEKRTQIRWAAASSWPIDGPTVIAVGQTGALNTFAGRY